MIAAEDKPALQGWSVIKLALESGRLRQAVAALVGVLGCQVAIAASLELQVIDEQGVALEHAAVALKPVGAVPPITPGKAEIIQQGKRFIPLMTAVPTGTAISFPNRDTVRHHVYSFSPAKPFELKLYIGTPAEPELFDKPGVVVMGCNIHDHMVAYVVVSDTPWVGVSDAAGRVRIDGAPAGEYTLEYWHPRWAGSTNEPKRVPLGLSGDDRHTLVIGAQP
jgi:plastocyanin